MCLLRGLYDSSLSPIFFFFFCIFLAFFSLLQPPSIFPLSSTFQIPFHSYLSSCSKPNSTEGLFSLRPLEKGGSEDFSSYFLILKEEGKGKKRRKANQLPSPTDRRRSFEVRFFLEPPFPCSPPLPVVQRTTCA